MSQRKGAKGGSGGYHPPALPVKPGKEKLDPGVIEAPYNPWAKVKATYRHHRKLAAVERGV